MVRPGAPLSVLLRRLSEAAERQERELDSLRALLLDMRIERDTLLEQLQFATDYANRETRAAASLRAELLERTSAPNEERHDYCGDGHETTGVLPRPRPARRSGKREDETERCIRDFS